MCVQESSLPLNKSLRPKFRDFAMFDLTREERGGGGLVTLVHESINVEDWEIHISEKVECMKLKLRINKDWLITLVNVYIPGQGIKETDLDVLIPDSPNYCIMGDFNSRHKAWNTGKENGNGLILYRWIQKHGVLLLNQGKKQHISLHLTVHLVLWT